MRINITFFAVLLLFSLSTWAQTSLEGQIRPRAEFRNGYRMLPPDKSKPAGQVNQRTRLMLSHAFDNRVRTNVAVQDLRIWGQDLTMNTRPSFGVYEAWLELIPNERFRIMAGRQELRYDNQRLMAINDWSLSGRTHDAVVVRYTSKGGSQLHFGSAFNQNENLLFGTGYRPDNYKTLNYLWYSTGLGDITTLSLHGIADGWEHPDDPGKLYIRATWASYLVTNPGMFQLRLYPAYQHGNTRFGQNISAYYILAEAATDITENWSSILGVELFSGNDQVDPGDTFTAFDDLYGAGHGRNGFMDYFTNFPQHTGNAGLINPYLRNTFNLSEHTTLAADLHLFYLHNDFPDPVDATAAVDKYLGTEIDLVLTYRFNEFTRIVAGYSVLFATGSMEAIKGGSKDEFAHWAFVMVRMSPKFF